MIPVIKIEGDSIAEVWEKSLIELWEKGISIKTEYDRENNPPSKDCIMIMVIKNPFSEPRIHLAFPGGIEDLEKYRQEIVEGIHDAWIKPEEKKWTYTYHDRLSNYHIPGKEDKINQIDYIINKLSETPYSRRAQGITWIPFYDPFTYDPPCLQRIWCRITEKEGKLFLNMNTHWRSRDAYRAAFMNLFGLTSLQKFIADEISKKAGKEVKIGQYVDISDSYHIYGESFDDFKNRFLTSLEKRDFFNPDHTKSRTLRSDDPIAIAGFEYGKQLIEMEKRTGKLGTLF
ncbi:MAG: thymidylate synthase [Candidatus Omnitrophica bacterium]|nr:thymidylate synthase [Candidatus Omnitrophota bacterium]MCM8810891.1 thymidylate synthase [Candidatus Omnitrophota bacterium]MCM8832508.1 thymidylate synthase [Candidatus Omnitrophota bacterium]